MINKLIVFDVKDRKSSLFRYQSNRNLVGAFFKICETLEINQMVEIGAKEASASINFMQKPGRSAIAIEANPYTFEKFTTAARIFGVEVLNVGIGNFIGKSLLKIPVYGKSLTPANASFLNRVEPVNTHDCEINLITLDSLQTNFISNKNTALWIDVEGFGFEVLEGASKYLKFYSPVIFMEVESINHWQNQKNVDAILDKLRLFDFIPILRDEEYETQYNIIFIKRDLSNIFESLISEFVKNHVAMKISLLDLLKYKESILNYKLKRLILSVYKIMFNSRIG
jgi:FkbM family methyltransferase